MSNNYALLTFPANSAQAYIDDRGVSRGIKANYKIPPGISAASVALINGASGGRARLPGDAIACPESGFRPRKLIFYSDAGGSIGVPIGDRTQLVAAATVIRGALIADGFNVVCIKLEGEEFDNLVDELRPAGFTGVVAAATSSRPATGKQTHYYGKAPYRSDGLYGVNYTLSYKIASETENGIPAIYASVFANLGIVPIAGIQSCPGKDPRTSRRWIAQSLVTENAVVKSQRTELPSFIHLPATILLSGQQLATLTHVQCLGYKGENNDRFHKIVP